MHSYVFAAAVALMVPVGAMAQCEIVKFTQPDAPENGNFGLNVSMEGDVFVVGAGQTLGDPTPGAAYVYRRVDGVWVEEQRLEPSDGDVGDAFGTVGISKDVIVVGAWQDSDLVPAGGSAYIYRFNGIEWVEEQKLVSPTPNADDFFGIIPHIDGSVAAIPSSGDDAAGPDTGAVYMYRHNGASWELEATLVSGDPQTGAGFGFPVVVHEERVIVGAYLTENDPGTFGAAYVYEFDGDDWNQVAKLTANPEVPGDTYGLACWIEGDIAAVGAMNDNDDGPAAGAIYVYRFDGDDWVQEQKLTGSQPDDVGFGNDICISNGVIMVGCNDATIDGLPSAGRAYLFKHDGVQWVEIGHFNASDPGDTDWFANAVALWGDTAVCGSRLDDSPGEDDGSVYVFDVFETLGFSGDCNANGTNDLIDLFVTKTSSDCNDNGIPDECDIASGVSDDMDGDGVPDECQSCIADANGDGVLNILDFVAFQNLFQAGCPL